MNKKVLFIVISLLVVIGGSVAYLLVTDDAKQAKDTMTSASSPPAKAAPQPAGEITPGSYVDYSENVVANTAGTKILFFHAPWCPQCRALEADIKAKGVPSGVTIIKVDYDANQALRQKYEVPLQTTLVLIDDNGNLVKRYVAYDEPTVEAVKSNLL
jgi:thiol-disulfide isomerase/thioredoxin